MREVEWKWKREEEKKNEMGENIIEYSNWNGIQTMQKCICFSDRDKDKMDECDHRMCKMVTQLNNYALFKCITIKWSALFRQFSFLSLFVYKHTQLMYTLRKTFIPFETRSCILSTTFCRQHFVFVLMCFSTCITNKPTGCYTKLCIFLKLNWHYK